MSYSADLARARAAFGLAYDEGMEVGERAGNDEPGASSRAISNSLKKVELFDGVPKHVSESIWTQALKKCPPPKRGKNTAAEKEYRRRIDAYKIKVQSKVEKRLAEEKKKTATVQAVEAAGLKPTISAREVLEEAEADICDAVDDWQELSKMSVSAASHPDNVLRSVSVSPPTDKIEFELPHGHRVLAESRAFLDRKLRLKGLNAMLGAQAKASVHQRCVIFDVGSGASGVKKAMDLMQDVQGADGLYHHCSFPVACASDLARENTLGNRMGLINWIREGVEPELGKVNVCNHRASECDCLKFYHQKFVMAVHSQYYFTDSDWASLFKYTDVVWTATHVPEALGRPVPCSDPEFVWLPIARAATATLAQKWRARLRTYVVGPDDQVVFEPLLGHGTTYVQKNPRVDVNNGGFHMVNGFVRSVADWVNTDAGLLVAAAGKSAAITTVTRGAVESFFRRSWKPVLKSLALGVILAAPASIARAVEVSRSLPVPPPNALYTVRIVNGYTLTYKGENLGHVLKYMRAPLGELEPRVLDTYIPNRTMVNEVATTLALSKKDKQQNRGIAVSKCLREGLNEIAVRDTVRAAEELVDRLLPKNEELTPPDTWSNLATVASLSALVGSTHAITQEACEWYSTNAQPLLSAGSDLRSAIVSSQWVNTSQARELLSNWLNYTRNSVRSVAVPRSSDWLLPTAQPYRAVPLVL